MKHDLKGYHTYQRQAQPESAAASTAENASDPREIQADPNACSDKSGREPGNAPEMDDLAQEAGDTESANPETEQLRQRCRELEDRQLRALAEMDNFKKRLIRERDEQARYAAEAVLADILPALDNFELALSYGQGNEACADLVAGLALAQKSLLETLARHGLTSVGEAGEAFNPEIHEALTQEPNPDIPTGHVSQIFQKGYLLRGRLLRPAKVIVSAG